MARGGGGLAGVSRGSGGRREAGSADEPRTEPELERAAAKGPFDLQFLTWDFS